MKRIKSSHMVIWSLFGLLLFTLLGAVGYGLARDLRDVTRYRSARLAPAPDPDSLSVMLYNIGHLRGNVNDPENHVYFGERKLSEWKKIGLTLSALIRSPGCVERKLEDVIRTIRSFDPDILLLNEADLFYIESGFRNLTRAILDRTDLNYAVYGRKWDSLLYRSGNAILSKYPIAHAENLLLNDLTFFRRLVGMHTCLKARINIHGDELEFYNTHLHSRLALEKKKQQIQTLEAHASHPGHIPKIFCGDYNYAWSRRDDDAYEKNGDYTRHFLEHGGFDPDSFHPDLTIDYILFRNRDSLSFEHRGKIHSNASDHHPIAVTIQRNTPHPALVRQ